MDWKMPAEVVAAEKAYVESMARIRFEVPGQKLEGGLTDWFSAWVPRFFSTPVAQAFTACFAAFVLALWRCPQVVVAFVRDYGAVFAAVTLALVYWFLTAPHVRFAYGFLAAASILLLLAAGEGFITATAGPRQGRNNAVGLVGSLFAVALLFSSPRPYPGDALGTGVAFTDFYPNRLDRMRRGKAPRRAFLFQDTYPLVETRPFPLGSLPLYRPLTGQHCWDAPLSCTPYLYRRIEARGVSLASGFRVIPGPVEVFDGRRLVEEWQQQTHRSGQSGAAGGL